MPSDIPEKLVQALKLENDGKNKGGAKFKFQSPFRSLPPELANTVQRPNRFHDIKEQVEAITENFITIQQGCLPRGLILNEELASAAASLPTRPNIPERFESTALVLGKGNSAGQVVEVIDRKTKKHLALKTISVSQFNKDEIYLWLHLGDADMAPELCHFELCNNKMFLSMEIMTGKNLQDIMDDTMMIMHAKYPQLARSFSLCILYDLLKIQEKMREKNFIHGDIHGSNVRLEYSMAVKLFDFGQAKSLLNEDDNKRLVKKDIINLIRLFCGLYFGNDFGDSFQALGILESLQNLNPFNPSISDEHRKEMYTIVNDLLETVRDWRSEGYGDTTEVASEIQALIKDDIDEIKQRAAVIIFPERFQHPLTQRGSTDSREFELICDDENKKDFATSKNGRRNRGC